MLWDIVWTSRVSRSLRYHRQQFPCYSLSIYQSVGLFAINHCVSCTIHYTKPATFLWPFLKCITLFVSTCPGTFPPNHCYHIWNMNISCQLDAESITKTHVKSSNGRRLRRRVFERRVSHDVTHDVSFSDWVERDAVTVFDCTVKWNLWL